MNEITTIIGEYSFRANEYLNSVADRFSYSAPIPMIGATYQFGSEAIARVGGVFSNAFRESFRRKAKDPFSTRMILRALRPVEDITRYFAVKKPTQIPGLHFLDQSLTSIHQHLYTYMKEVNDLLDVPGNMRSFLGRFSIGALLDQSAQMGGEAGLVVNRVRKIAAEILFFIMDQVIWIIDLLFQTLFSSPDLTILGYLKEIIKTGRKKLQGTIRDHANRAVDRREARIRSQLVQAVANATNEFVVTLVDRVTFKTILGLAAYSLLEMGLSSTIPASYLRTAAGATTMGLLWHNVYKPYLQEFYDAYNPQFNPTECHLRDFLSFHEYRELYLPLHGTKKFFQKVEQD